ncbi:IS630 family transposase [Variovorax sp. WS11]|uniref:IS630 family transposase n=1 Tax=Variovorax sp. WS11 TaxID=1105204 RepID=UPI000D0CB361|nr:IS630 family transposase [Variovorax sp. WS11]NDZ16692.1 IS630 family transposase [Variovorax sp. WS11]NDZ16765.1 IS630 family transposase [Variovorax sp. WS11]NDZ17851.1 IS630 family transposase [Variovorax sp. WS11]NDZ18411.1 IS630 family transposase [Variovorax sp. WS11]PSL78920.1 IS630 family transposase [Variovorax sp. WS11]
MKRDGRTLAHNTLEEMRVVAVQRMNEGEHPAAVAASFGMNRSWAYKCKAAARGRGRGLKALRSTKGTGRPRKLTSAQERQVFRWVNGKRPDQYGFDFGLWTRQIVQELLLARFEVSLSLASIGALLARLGLTTQKPLQRAYQRDPAAVARWKSEIFPAIATEAQASEAEILFWDESGFRADSVHGKTWAKKGQTPVIDRPGQRQSISAASAVTAKGAFWFATYSGALTGELFVELLKQLMRKRRKPVRLIVDGLPAHKKAIVKEYVASTAGKLTLHFLPGYAPDLNPDELVWSHAKRTGVARSPLKAGEKLQCRVDGQLQAIAEDSALVRSFFRHPSVSYISDL